MLRSLGSRVFSTSAPKPVASAPRPSLAAAVAAAASPQRKLSAVLVGRPNCGKSAIWNRLVGQKKSIVSSVAGTTRDRRQGEAKLGELEFSIVDTGGLEDSQGHISAAMKVQTGFAINEADCVLFCVDAKQGVTRDDEHFARWVRKHISTNRKPAFCLANKSEGLLGVSEDFAALVADCRRLGFGEPIPFSAAQGEGLGDLFAALAPVAKTVCASPVHPAATDASELVDVVVAGDAAAGRAAAPIKLTILGRPNVGKSSLLNALVGTQRVVTGPVAGTTRDPVQVKWTYQDRDVVLVDTAGLGGGAQSALYQASKKLRAAPSPDKRMAAEAELIEGLAADASLRALRETHVACLVVDLSEAGAREDPKLTRTDAGLIEKIHDAGRALIVVANKVDRVKVQHVDRGEVATPSSFSPPRLEPVSGKDAGELVDWLRREIAGAVPQLDAVQVVVVSTSEGTGMQAVMPAVLDAHRKWSARVSTSKLIRWLAVTTNVNPPPAQPVLRNDKRKSGSHKLPRARDIPVRIKYACQVSTRPPTFGLWVNRHNPEHALPAQYQRYLVRCLRRDFDLEGVPVRLLLRSSPNPYAAGEGHQHKRLPGRSKAVDKPDAEAMASRYS
jgi:GTP-binding protein